MIWGYVCFRKPWFGFNQKKTFLRMAGQAWLGKGISYPWKVRAKKNRAKLQRGVIGFLKQVGPKLTHAGHAKISHPRNNTHLQLGTSSLYTPLLQRFRTFFDTNSPLDVVLGAYNNIIQRKYEYHWQVLGSDWRTLEQAPENSQPVAWQTEFQTELVVRKKR